MGLQATLLDFISETQSVRRVAIDYRNDAAAAACLVYLLDYGRVWRDSEYRSRIQSLGAFDYWDRSRLRLLADVPLSLFDSAFALPKSQLVEFGHRLLASLATAELLEVTDSRGTHLSVSLRCPAGWYANVGNPADHILPCGELSARPAAVDGRVCFVGTILGTLPFGFKYGLIQRGDLILDFRNGLLTSVGGNNRMLVRDLEMVISRCPGITRVGETSLSFNSGIGSLSGVGYQWEERFPGFHFALGAELTENLEDLAERECLHHLDFVFADCVLTANRRTIFRGREFSL